MDEWLRKRLTVITKGAPKSPWWQVKEPNGDCYRKLRGNRRQPGFYVQNSTAQ
jgi:hypothetical protein